MNKHVVMFDKFYDSKKQKEGLAVHWAVVSGACNLCKYLPECETNEKFKFPKDAPCMMKKRGEL